MQERFTPSPSTAASATPPSLPSAKPPAPASAAAKNDTVPCRGNVNPCALSLISTGRPLMQADLHYYVTFIAARAAGWCHEDAAEIALAAHYVDCSGDLDELKAPWKNSETLQKTITCVAQLSVAVENMRTMSADNQFVWSAFHFLPGFDSHPDSRYDYAYDDRPWSLMSGTGVDRREPSEVTASGWVYSQAVKPKAKFATPRAYKLAMRCFPNSRTIAAMTNDTIQELNGLDSSRLHQRLKITPQANPVAKELAKRPRVRCVRRRSR